MPSPSTGASASGLLAHRERQEAERAGERRWADAGIVFATPIGSVIEPRNLSRVFEDLIAAVDVPRIRFHDLRHTCASMLLAQGVTPRVVMELLGHSTLSVTMDVYSHVMPSALRDAADAVDVLFGSSEVPA